jgi:choline dehydrogenase-like flavoprotein
MYDYIITGAGPAGCVLANRLTEDPSVKVLLIEAGGTDWHPYFHMPAGFAKMTKGLASWGWSTVPQKHLNGRVLRYTQAKVLGGGSSINAQVYTRGNARDYNAWDAEEGCAGWRYDDVLPYFKRAEDNQRFSDAYHASGGPLGVSVPVNPLPISEASFGRRRSTVSRSIRTSTAPSRKGSVTTRSRSATRAARRPPSPT